MAKKSAKQLNKDIAEALQSRGALPGDLGGKLREKFPYDYRFGLQSRKLTDRPTIHTGHVKGWSTTRGGYQMTTIDGTVYATLFDLREIGDPTGKVVDYTIGPKAHGYDRLTADIIKVHGKSPRLSRG